MTMSDVDKSHGETEGGEGGGGAAEVWAWPGWDESLLGDKDLSAKLSDDQRP